MGEGVKLVPKRKLIGLSDGGDTDVFISHILNNQTNIVPQLYSSWTISGAAPTFDFIESDQVDPAGRWRFRAYDQDFALERAGTAQWATIAKVLELDQDASITALYNTWGASGYTLIEGCLIAGQGSEIYIYGSSHAQTGAIDLKTPNAAASATVSRLTISGKAATADITVADANFKMGTNPFYVASIVGDGTNNITIQPNNATTNSTERTLTIRLLDATGDQWMNMITFSPNGASPTIDFNSRAITSVGKITSSVSAGSPILKATATSDTPTATWGAAAGNEVSTAPSGWLEIQDGSDNTRYIPFWA